MIAAERQRQIDAEDYTAEHDDAFVLGDDLARAAMAYTEAYLGNGESALEWWPWHPDYFKPRGGVADLVRAGALIAAEIDRLQRGDGGAA